MKRHILTEDKSGFLCGISVNKIADRYAVTDINCKFAICGACRAVYKRGHRVTVPNIQKYFNKKKKVGKAGDKFYGTYEWRELRYKALQLYGPRCMLCGADSKEAKICVDHIKPRAKYPELELDINNLQILCDACNHGKGRWDETDHRFTDPDKLEPEQREHIHSILKIVKG